MRISGARLLSLAKLTCSLLTKGRAYQVLNGKWGLHESSIRHFHYRGDTLHLTQPSKRPLCRRRPLSFSRYSPCPGPLRIERYFCTV